MAVDLVIIGLRFAQYVGAMILFGSSLFLVFGGLIAPETPAPTLSRMHRLLSAAAYLALATAPLQFLVQTASLAGSWPAALELGTLKAALVQMSFGKSAATRTGLALGAVILLRTRPPGRATWRIVAWLGAFIGASLAFSGHGAASEGTTGLLHLFADVVHILAAAAWIGALIIFWWATGSNALPGVTPERLSSSLTAFSGIGSLIVALILATGIINSMFLVGWDIRHVITSLYGQVLLAKLALFAVMLALAAANRFRFAPALARNLSATSAAHVEGLRRNLALETMAGFLLLAAVAWLGTLPPIVGP
jgi:putative copper resistance protein D